VTSVLEVLGVASTTLSTYSYKLLKTNAKEAMCRNPTLAKCGGEAQYLEKARIWSPPGLPNV